MGFLIRYIDIYAPWIYAICGLVALYHIYKTWQVRAERKQALFSLEREKAMRDLFNILFVSIVLLLVMGATYFSSQVLARALEFEETIRPIDTPTAIVIPIPPTPLSTPIVEVSEPTSTPSAVPTEAPEQVVEEIVPDTPTPEPLFSPTCPDPRAQLASPAVGQTIAGQVTVSGTAIHEKFQYYKLEYAAGANAQGGFVYLVGGNSPVNSGVVGRFDSTALANGVWTLRLVVVDTTGNFPPPCSVTINVQN